MIPGTGAETAIIKRLGREAGFDLVRIAAATALHQERARYLRWIEQGRQGEMRWITPDWADRSSDPGRTLPEARAVICVGLAYWKGAPPADASSSGRVARYAWGRDYHAVLGEQLQLYAAALRERFGGEHRWLVDTGPLMDKAIAARAGLGWYGKNTNLLTERFGSWVVLGEIMTTLAIEPDAPLRRDCGACRLCLLACPTGALGPDYSIDSRKCISYLTIEHRGAIAPELRPSMGSWVFGCDICQDVCPPAMQPYLRTPSQRRAWARGVRRQIGRPGRETSDVDQTDDRDAQREPAVGNPLFATGTRPALDLTWLLQITHEEYVGAFRGTAMRRAKAWMLRRNAAVALGNVGGPGALPALARALETDEHPIVRGHSAWALGRLACRHDVDVSNVLESALETESDASVRREIEGALGVVSAQPRASV